MGKFENAVDFYLRGFNSQYIKRRTGIPMQSLLKQLKAKGIVYTKGDIIAYQVAYIRDRYTPEEMKVAYREMVQTHDDVYKASRGRHINMLGCGFGDHAKVLRQLLGEDEYATLRNESWKEKQVATMRATYGVSNAFEKASFESFVTPEAVAEGRVKRTATLIDRYGVEHPNQHPDIASRMMAQRDATNQERYGTTNPMQVPEVAAKSAVNRQQAMLERYGAANSVEVKAIRDKIFASRKQNKTLNTSNPEEVLGVLLRDRFGADDVLHHVVVDDRYPYHVDYYIKSLDLFIELNGDRCHNDHWFDPSNPRDVQIVRAWSENMERIESETGRPSRYRQYIKTWTVSDVAKRQAARANDLNYLVFWDGSSVKRNKRQEPRLRDVYTWLAEGCPMPKDWLAEHTY